MKMRIRSAASAGEVPQSRSFVPSIRQSPSAGSRERIWLSRTRTAKLLDGISRPFSPRFWMSHALPSREVHRTPSG